MRVVVYKNDLHASKYPISTLNFKSSITINKKNVAAFVKKILKYYQFMNHL